MVDGDPRVEAAWLFGSVGRGDADELSDLDLTQAVADDHLDAVAGNPVRPHTYHSVLASARGAFVAQLAPPAWICEAPQNAPPRAAFLTAFYDGTGGPHQVDWIWQARSVARRPAQETVLLVDRCGIGRDDGPLTLGPPTGPVPVRTPVEAVVQSVCSGWAMLLWNAKRAARVPGGEQAQLLRYAVDSVRAVERFVGSPSGLEDVPAHPGPEEKLRLLRDLAGRLEALAARLGPRGVAVPDGAAGHVHRYLDLVERIVVLRARSR